MPAPISYADALALIAAQAVAARVESIDLALAGRRVLAESVRLARDQPPFDRATMDGFALRPQGGRRFRVIGTAHAGGAPADAPGPGEALRIMTGAPCPPGTTVVPIEATRSDGDAVVVDDQDLLIGSRNIARRGEDGRVGDQLVGMGTRMTPALLACAALSGSARVLVRCRPRVAIIRTGDELAPGADASAGIIDTNGPFLAAFAEEAGCEACSVSAIDDARALADALAATVDAADLVVTSGGVSAGDRDLVATTAAAMGFVRVFHGVAIQPGKPTLLARHPDGRLLLGLPGNPVAVVAGAHLFFLPVLARMLGGWAPPWLELPLVAAWPAPKRHLFLPARFAAGGVEPLRWNGSGDLIAAAAGDGLVEFPAGAAATPGAVVRFLPYLGAATGARSSPTRLTTR